MKQIISLLCVSGFLMGPVAMARAAQAPAPQQNAPAIEVAARPEHVAPGTPVTIQGTVAVKGSNAVSITVKPPSGSPFTQTVWPDGNGSYSMQFKDTKPVGTYQAQATMGASSAAATFAVSTTEIAQDTIQQIQAVLRAADYLVQQGKRQNASSATPGGGNSANVDKAIALSQVGIADAKELWTPSGPGSATPGGLPTFADVLLDVTQQLQSRPDLASRFAANLNQLQAWSEQAGRNLKRLKNREPMLKSMQSMNRKAGGILEYVSFPVTQAAESEGGAGTCETAEKTAEYFELAGTVLNLIGTPMMVLLNLVTQAGGQGLLFHTGMGYGELSESYEEGQKAVEEYVADWEKQGMNELLPTLDPSKLAPRPGMPLGLKLTGLALASHLASWLAEAFLEGVCGEWTGPFRATMHAEAEADGNPWWKYTVEIAGTLTLYFNKTDWEDKGDVPFIGEFEGRGTNFTVWEDALPVLYPKLFRPGMTISYHKVAATRVTNLTLCTDCVFPLRSVAVAQGDGADQGMPIETPGLTIAGVTPGPNGVSGQPSNVLISLFPGMKALGSLATKTPWSASYFRVPVKGQMQTNVNGDHAEYQGKVSLTVEQAENDWDPDLINAHVRYLVIPTWAPLAVPILIDFGLPYQPAEFILKRALGNTDHPPGDTTAAMNITPGLASGEAAFNNLAINFENKNDMPRTPVPAPQGQSQTAKADYSIALNVVKKGNE